MTRRKLKSDASTNAPKRKTNGQFRKGHSGNPLGRPLKQQRSLTDRQLVQDIQTEAERVVEVNGERRPAIVLILRALTEAAVAGDKAAAKQFLQLHALAGERTAQWEAEEAYARREAERAQRESDMVEAFRLAYPEYPTPAGDIRLTEDTEEQSEDDDF